MSIFTIRLIDVVKRYGLPTQGLPFKDTNDKNRVLAMFMRRFAYREIAHETPQFFLHRFHTRMMELLPEYNLKWDIAAGVTTDVWTSKHKSVVESSGSSENSSTGGSSAKSSNAARTIAYAFPQTALSGNADYAREGTDTTSATTNTGTANETATGSNTGRSVSEVMGYSFHPVEIVARNIALVVNVDMEFLERFETLFMGLWDSESEVGGHVEL